VSELSRGAASAHCRMSSNSREDGYVSSGEGWRGRPASDTTGVAVKPADDGMSLTVSRHELRSSPHPKNRLTSGAGPARLGGCMKEPVFIWRRY